MARDRRPGRGFHERANELLTIDVSEAVLAQHWDVETRYKEFGARAPHPDAAGPTMKRLAETVLKVAALLAIDRGGSEIVVDDLASATALAERWKRTTLALLADLGRTRFQARCDAVLGTIRAHPNGVGQAGLYRAHRDLDKREFENVTEALEMQRLAPASRCARPASRADPSSTSPAPRRGRGCVVVSDATYLYLPTFSTIPSGGESSRTTPSGRDHRKGRMGRNGRNPRPPATGPSPVRRGRAMTTLGSATTHHDALRMALDDLRLHARVYNRGR